MRTQPNLILAIEEPELYLHPNRQRHLARVLLGLSQGKLEGVAAKIQVVYTTHSPHFVGLDRFHHVRLFRKAQSDARSDGPRATAVHSETLDRIARVLEKADAKPASTYSGDTLRPRLQTLMTPWMSEGFFADLVVLVEGEEDRAAILASANAIDYDLEQNGISVIPCLGKNSIDRPAAIFSSLGIGVYAVWDGDHGTEGANPESNHRLLRLFGLPAEDWPQIDGSHCTCFGEDLSKALCQDLGEECYAAALETCRNKYEIGRKRDAEKNPVVLQDVLTMAREQGKAAACLEILVRRIADLRSNLPEGREKAVPSSLHLDQVEARHQ